MAVPNGICVVFHANASHSDMLPKILGAQMPAKPRRSISCASSMVRRRRDGTATRLTAGMAEDMAAPGEVSAGQTADRALAMVRRACWYSGMERKFDCLIVGAGIIGLAHALAAARQGLRVGVLERE